MQFSISATLVTLALATMGLAAPTTNSVDVAPPPNPGPTDGTVTPMEDLIVPDTGLSKRTLGLVYICPAL